VNVLTTDSKLASGTGILSADKPISSTGNGDAAIRFRASLADVSEGSTPTTLVTVRG
jgi:hypothetical protein